MSTELEAVARKSWEAFSAKDRDGWRALLREDCIYKEAGTGREARGADAVTDMVFGWFSIACFQCSATPADDSYTSSITNIVLPVGTEFGSNGHVVVHGEDTSDRRVDDGPR